MTATGSHGDMNGLSNGVFHSALPIERALRLPQTPGIEINIHLTVLSRSVLLFVTSTAAEAGRQAPPSMGSFVYSIPDRYNTNEQLSTTLYYAPNSIDFASRLARLLARRTGLPCYVGNSISLTNTPGGGSVEEEIEAFKAVSGFVLQEISARKEAAKREPA